MLQLGIVTYNIARHWDLETILERLERLGFGGVELRTTHAHGVEVELDAQAREAVKARFADSAVELVGLGSAFEYHAADPDELKRNIAGTKDYIRLAHDVGALGIKVRPNGVPPGVDPEATFAQIARALREVGDFGLGFGVEIRVEVHGRVTKAFPAFARIMAMADHPNVKVCWNSNDSDVRDGSIAETFAMVRDRIGLVHLRDLYLEDYPFRELFRLLEQAGYQGFTLAEIPASPDPERVLRYYKALWDAYQPNQRS